MPQDKPYWADSLKSSPFAKSRFTKELQNKVMNRIRTKKSKRSYLVVVSTVTLGLALLIGIVLLPSVGYDSPSGKSHAPLATEPPTDKGSNGKNQYYENGKLLLSVFPEPELESGKTAGYIFSMTAPFDVFRGKLLSIYAIHISSGQKVTAVAPVEVTEPSPGYPSLDRFTARFGLPFSGQWRYVVELDGQDYANVELAVNEPSWEVSPEFRSGSYLMRGIEKKVGFIDAGFIAGKTNKYMWHFWGTPKDLDGKFEVKAVKQGETRMIDVFASDSLGGAHNGADRNIPSSMSLPEPGLWRLLPFVNGRLIESIVVDVK